MVSCLQVQCLNCGKVEQLPVPARQTGEFWCPQCCGFTRPVNELVSNPPQLFQRTQGDHSGLREDEELVALFSKNLFLSQPQQQQPDRQSTPPQTLQSQSAAPTVNYSISQHYHHYRPVAPATEPLSQPPQAEKPSTPPADLEHLQHKATQLQADAYADYQRQAQLMEEQYNRQVVEHQSQNPGLIGSPVSTVVSVNDDYQLQMALLEHDRQNVQLQQEEDRMIFEQLMAEQSQQQGQFVPQRENGAWTGGQPMPPKLELDPTFNALPESGVYPAYSIPLRSQPDPAFRTAEDFNKFYSGVGDSEMMDDEESPCVIYHSRNYRMQYHFI